MMEDQSPKAEKNTEDNIVHTIDKTDLQEATMKRSRLKSAQTATAKKNIVMLIIGLIALGIVLLFVGPPLLIQFSILLGNMRSDEDVNAVNTQEESFVAPPVLKQPEKATKEKTITIKGTAEPKQTIELYVNGDLKEKKSITGSDFTFSGVELKEGENMIRVVAVSGKKESNLSEPVKVTYREKAPEIEVETPKDGDAFSGGVSILKVKGKTAPHAKVTINDAWAIMDDEGIFRYDFRMQSGENKILVKATDEVGNVTEKEVKFTYAP